MRLSAPTDFEILDSLADGKRNTAANLAKDLDKERSYINARLPILEDYGLLKKIGPATNSGLYEITEKGQHILEIHQEEQPVRTSQFDYETALKQRIAD